MDLKTHWDALYKTKAPNETSWYQEHPSKSLELIKATGIGQREGMLIDVGGGASTLVDRLLSDGFQRITVLDISPEALQQAKTRLGTRAECVTWIEGDITQVILPYHLYDLWHDRAVFHFLISPDDRQHYLRTLNDAVKPGGHAILAAFALDGPPQCSGLEVMRYDPETLSEALGRGFRLVESAYEEHQTPSGAHQRFVYCRFRRDPV